jgi:hypothetical protein
VVSTQLVNNGSERERYAQTQKQIQKRKKKKKTDDKWRNAKSTMPNNGFFFFFFNHSLQLVNLNAFFLNEFHLLYVFHIQLLLNKNFDIINIDMLIVQF